MSMTREEAITYLQEEYDCCKSFYDLAAHPEEDYPEITKYLQALQIALSALRPITREQVEKVWRGEWIDCSNGWMCSRCEHDNTYAKPFCPNCGAPMTDKAVDMVMERLEVMKDGNSVKR